MPDTPSVSALFVFPFLVSAIREQQSKNCLAMNLIAMGKVKARAALKPNITM